MKLCLGTVQFGLRYGIAGNDKPNLASCIEILDYAYQNNISSFDTAAAYGDAEDVLGEFIKQKKINQYKIEINSKISPDIFKEGTNNNWYIRAKECVINSLRKLNIDCLDGYMLHNANALDNEEAIAVLDRLKKEGYVKKIGASVYKPNEAKKTFSYREMDIIQIPYNIFDQRLDKEGFFKSEIIDNKKIYARSAFLQGLLLMPVNEIPSYLSEAIPKVKRFEELCESYNMTRKQAAVSFVKNNDKIDYLVFGIDNLNQLKEFIEIFSKDAAKSAIKQISKEFTQISDEIVMPFLWNK
ncbi:aldo/keto reductase [Ruminiclostridium herbifermentans]|uniref:Aldo/keto reductase n=1 Tax=Ruminiclostridium herbifermentans TaxID=2488810 RepID=A0A4U7JGS5_9FIRM|nr:aldo/keto reductase [Ruminiclostridium herbifermentans]QNU67118.1 aldo/keto reductase [Ruminiclostridium herbifermentans]